MTAGERDGDKAHRVGFLLVPRFSMIAFSSALEVLRLANYVSGSEDFAWSLYSPDGKPVDASNGIEVAVDGAYRDAPPMPAIIVCAGLGLGDVDAAPLTASLRKLAARGVALGALCTGTYFLAKAHLLDGYRCTIHWENFDSLREDFPDLDVTQELYEIDRNRYTCGGGTAAIDMMLAYVEARKGAAIATQVTDELIHHRMRDADEAQRMELRERLGVSHPKLLAVIAEMDRQIEQPLSLAEIADHASLSARQLERLFKRYLGTTPTNYYRAMRLDKARHLLRQTTMPVLSVALACGFVSASHFSKCYGDNFGRTPSEERQSMRRSAPSTTTLAG